jgi:hypothetical protein
MSANSTSITVNGVNALIAQLDKDRVTIANSGLSLDKKTKIDNLIVKIQNQLRWQLSQNPPDFTSWSGPGSVQSDFTNLTSMVGNLLGELGACFYDNGLRCINCSQLQCIALGGVFHAGILCP